MGKSVTTSRTISAPFAILPLRFAVEGGPPILEVRGEVYMTNEDLADLNLRQVEAGAEPYKNTRNVTAGTIRLLDPVDRRGAQSAVLLPWCRRNRWADRRLTISIS